MGRRRLYASGPRVVHLPRLVFEVPAGVDDDVTHRPPDRSRTVTRPNTVCRACGKPIPVGETAGVLPHGGLRHLGCKAGRRRPR